MSNPIFYPGSYTLLYPLRLREGPGLNYTWKFPDATYSQGSGARRKDGTLPPGTKVIITEIHSLSLSTWGKTEEGWLCLYMSGTCYVEGGRK